MKPKNATLFAISLACALILTGCGSNNSEPSSISSAGVTQPSDAPTETASPDLNSGSAMPEVEGPEPEFSSTQMFCDITDAKGKVTLEDVILADNIAVEMQASGNDFLVSSAQNYEVFADNFQLAIDEKKSQLSPYEMEIITKSCTSAVR